MAILYSKIAGVVRWSGGQMSLGHNTTIDSRHPLVAERPDLFEEREQVADIPWHAPQAPTEPPIERATRAPGERRTAVKRAGKPTGGE